MLDFIKENPIICIIAFLLVVSPSLLFGAVQVIAVVVLVIVIIAIIGLAVLRWKVSSLQKSAEQNFQQQQQQQQQFKQNQYSTPNNKKVADDVGDYVEFEEIKEE